MYVSGYALKKVMGKGASDYYQEVDLQPPFSLMSRNPGIGTDYLERYGEELIQFGKCQVEGFETALPRFYRDKLDIKNTPEYFERMEDVQRKILEERAKLNTVEAFQDYIKHSLDADQQAVWNMEYFKRLENRGVL